MRRGLMFALVLAGIAPAEALAQRSLPGAEPKGPYCSGDYADDLSALAPRVREVDRLPQSQYSYCVRNTATYECLSYSTDGTVRRTRRHAILHGTAFAFKKQGNGDALFLTNDHVAEWPSVTDEDHSIEGIPNGCKRVSDSIKIVDSEADAYERDDIPLTRVIVDAQLDVAILKGRTQVSVLPWRIGKSSALKARNVVEVRGFPLGVIQATNVGKVVSAFDHDDYKDWDHVDFVVDALLSPGNSGSPVLAVSCRTGEFELVGVYHANYTHGSALNVVVGIDQIRDMMTTLKRPPRVHTGEPVRMGSDSRALLLDSARSMPEPFFPLGPLPALVRARPDDSLVFEVFSREFPLKAQPIMMIEDLAPQSVNSFGEVGRTWFGGAQGFRPYARADLDAETQAQVARLIEVLRHDALVAFAYRQATRDAITSRERFERVSGLERELNRATATRRDIAQIVTDMADRLAPHGLDASVPATDAFVTPTETAQVKGPSGIKPPGKGSGDPSPQPPPAAPHTPGPAEPPAGSNQAGNPRNVGRR